MTEDGRELRRGWTTGACAAAAAKAAASALASGIFPDPVDITLPGGQRPAFALARHEKGADFASASIVKDAGDDPDVTHGAVITATLRSLPGASGLRFRAGPGVGTFTLAGLPFPPGEPAINPVPRRMIAQAILEGAGRDGFEVEIAVEGGEKLAEKTLNPRLGIVGGLSILGTSGIVIPFSCAAWIHSIWRGIDVARAAGLTHILGATGRTSESAGQKLHGLPDLALIDMGDFVGGMLKYLKTHQVAKVSIAGGIAKMTKLAQGMLDVHSKRGLADLEALSLLAHSGGADEALVRLIASASSVAHAFSLTQAAHFDIGALVAKGAWTIAAQTLDRRDVMLEILVFDREGALQGRADFAPAVHSPAPFQP